MDELIASIRDVREKLNRGAFSNEDQVSKGVVMRLLHQLGWDVYDPSQVSSEFRIGNKRADYALRHGPFGPAVLIEVKDVGKATPKGEDQLFDYCFREGVPVAVLTDGRLWNFYWPAGRGNYAQRRFAVVNLADDEVSGCAQMLNRYLGFDTVASGQFEEKARSDYTAYQKQLVAKQEFPAVLESLIARADRRVVGLFADEVEKRCGIRPDGQEVRAFLRSDSGPFATAQRAPKPSISRPQSEPSSPGLKKGPSSSVRSAQSSYTLHDQTRLFPTAEACYIAIFEELARRDPNFCQRFADLYRGRNLVWLARKKEELYDDPILIERRTAPLPGGWHLGLNIGNRDKDRRVRKACELSGIAYGSQLRVIFVGRSG